MRKAAIARGERPKEGLPARFYAVSAWRSIAGRYHFRSNGATSVFPAGRSIAGRHLLRFSDAPSAFPSAAQVDGCSRRRLDVAAPSGRRPTATAVLLPVSRNRLLTALVLAAITVLPAPASAGGASSTNSGTLVADAFSGCVAGANCDVLRIELFDTTHAHLVSNAVTATHSSGFGPAFRLRMSATYLITGTAVASFSCPVFFTPGSTAATQSCGLPAVLLPVVIRGEFEALRPHQVGTVTFAHTLSA